MKLSKLKAYSGICVALCLMLFILPNDMNAQNRKRKKKDETSKTLVNKRQKPKAKTIKSLTKSSKKIEGLFTIYQDTITGSLQMIITNDQINKEFIYFSQVADGVMDSRINRGIYKGSKVFKIEKYFNKIEFVTQNTSFYFDPESPLSKSKSANVSHGNMASIKIEAHDKKNGRYLINGN